MAGQTDRSGSVDRTLEVPGQARDHRIGLARAAEEDDIHAATVILVDQHADMHAAFECGRDRARRTDSGRNEGTHASRAHLAYRVGDLADVRHAIHHRIVEAEVPARQGRQFPIA